MGYSTQFAVVLAAAVLMQVVPESEAFRCYVCNSNQNQGCEDSFQVNNRIPLVECKALTGNQFGTGFGGGQSGQSGWGQGGQTGQPGWNQGGQPGQPGWQGGQPGQPGQPGWNQGGQPGQSGWPQSGGQSNWNQGGQSNFGSGGQGFGQPYCKKVTGKAPGTDGRTYTERQCAFDNYSGSSSDSCVATQDGSGYECRCFSDMCNGAQTKTKMALLPLLVMAALAVFFGRK